MGRLSLIAVATGFALLFGTTVHAQQQPSSPPPPPPAYGAPISLEQAKAAIAGAAAESKKNASVPIAQAKARMAASFRAPTKAYQDRLAAGETFILGLPGAVPATGGVPIVVDGKLIGAIGVSGATGLQDHQSAEAGAAAVK